jgi:sugar O-acyltransferase (sialic acid O-acetyltransferase NeuD family)
MKDIVIFGTGGFGREVANLIEDINMNISTWNMLGWLDGDFENHGKQVHELPVLGDVSWLASRPDVHVVVAVGGPALKKRIADSLGESRFATLIHPDVRIRSRIRIGKGSIICEGTQMTTNIELGCHVIVNLGCTVGHDSIIEDFVTISPGVNISGNVTIGIGTDLGTGSKIIQGINVGSWTVVGAGAVVSRELPANVTAVGVPARIIKERPDGWQKN